MLALVIAGNDTRSILVSDRGQREIRRFLRRHGIRRNLREFQDLAPLRPYWEKAAFCELRGDAHLQARHQVARRIVFGALAQYSLNMRSLQSLFQDGKSPAAAEHSPAEGEVLELYPEKSRKGPRGRGDR